MVLIDMVTKQVCYSFWVLSALSILNRINWIDSEKLVGFILSAQDPETGGIADRQGDMVDVFHTHFGVAGTSETNQTRLGVKVIELNGIHRRPIPLGISWPGRFGSGVLHARMHSRSKGTQKRMEGTAAKASMIACFVLVALGFY